MSLQPASLGRLWLGPQTGRGTAASTYYGFKANTVDLSPAQMYRNMGNLVGGNLLASGNVKTAAWGGGALVMPPALDDYIGWLLYGFAGSVSSVNVSSGVYAHYFPAGADSTAANKYLTARRKIPGSTTDTYEQITDLRPYRVLLGLTPGEYATFRGEYMGRIPTNPDGSGWSFSGKNPEDSCPLSCVGSFQMPSGTDVETATGLSLDITSVIPDLRRVLVQGTAYPFDFPVMGRVIQVQFTYLWEDPDLYSSLYYDTGAWSPTVYTTSYRATMQSGTYITGSTPYALEFYAAQVDWQAEPLALRGGDLIEMGMTGTVRPADSGHDWYLKLTNGTASYSWPS